MRIFPPSSNGERRWPINSGKGVFTRYPIYGVGERPRNPNAPPMYPRLLLHGVVLLPVWKRCRQIRLRRYGRLHRRKRLLSVMLAHRRRVRLVRPISPFFDAVCEDLHRRYRLVAQAGVTGDLTADTYALVAHHLAHAFQFADDLVDFHERQVGPVAPTIATFVMTAPPMRSRGPKSCRDEL